MTFSGEMNFDVSRPSAIILSCFVTGFLTLLAKTNAVQTNAGHCNTEHALTTNLACVFL